MHYKVVPRLATSWNDETAWLNQQAAEGWRLLQVVVPRPGAGMPPLLYYLQREEIDPLLELSYSKEHPQE